MKATVQTEIDRAEDEVMRLDTQLDTQMDDSPRTDELHEIEELFYHAFARLERVALSA